MKRYTFSGPKGEETVVIAPDERTARERAMQKRWAGVKGLAANLDIPGAGKFPYGAGLVLDKVEVAVPKARVQRAG